MALSVEDLYSAYMDTGEYAPGEDEVGQSFAADIWEFFRPKYGTLLDPEPFERDYGMYIPTYDPTRAHLAFQDKAASFKEAADTYTISKAATDRVYSEEMQKLSGGLQEEMAKGREISGSLGLRSGTLESALEDTMTTTANKAVNLGDRLDIQKETDLNAYNQKISDATLDYEGDIYETKEQFYDRVMASVARLTDIGAFRDDMAVGGMCYENADTGYLDTCYEGCKGVTSYGGYTGRRAKSECDADCKDAAGVEYGDYVLNEDGSSTVVCP